MNSDMSHTVVSVDYFGMEGRKHGIERHGAWEIGRGAGDKSIEDCV